LDEERAQAELRTLGEDSTEENKTKLAAQEAPERLNAATLADSHGISLRRRDAKMT
jgi:hypothetical protein